MFQFWNWKNMSFSKFNCLKIQLPQSLNHAEIEFLEIENDDDKLRFHFPYLIYSTGKDAIISFMSALILSQLVIWAVKNKKSGVYTENTNYKKDDIVGFQVSPTIAVEITSNRYQQKPLPWKMHFKWIFLSLSFICF